MSMTWRRFPKANAMQGPEFGVGVNYLRVCEEAIGQDALGGIGLAVGIRSVIEGDEKLFSMHYPCHSPTQRRWFIVTVAPLSDDGLGEVVVMHTYITQREMAVQEILSASTGSLDRLLRDDQSFVADMTTGPQGLALVRTIIDLAHSLKLKVVAEGVETEEQSRLLRVLGCDALQGFLFSKALPREQFKKMFLAGAPR